MVDLGSCGPSPLDGGYGVDDPRCEGEFVEGVFFLGGTFGGATTRTCTVPAKTALFFPVINSIFTEEEDAYPEAPKDFVDTALANGEFSATLDGEDLKIKRIAPKPFTLILLEDNIVPLRWEVRINMRTAPILLDASLYPMGSGCTCRRG